MQMHMRWNRWLARRGEERDEEERGKGVESCAHNLALYQKLLHDGADALQPNLGKPADRRVDSWPSSSPFPHPAAAMSNEAAVLKIMQGKNRPFGVQNLVDLLQTAGLKKAAIQKALDSLVEHQRVICKARHAESHTLLVLEGMHGCIAS
jgi:hypothetical protein